MERTMSQKRDLGLREMKRHPAHTALICIWLCSGFGSYLGSGLVFCFGVFLPTPSSLLFYVLICDYLSPTRRPLPAATVFPAPATLSGTE